VNKGKKISDEGERLEEREEDRRSLIRAVLWEVVAKLATLIGLA